MALLLLMGLGGLGIFFGFTHEGEDWMKWVFVAFVGLTILGIVSVLGIDKYQESNKKENRFPYVREQLGKKPHGYLKNRQVI